MPDSFRPFPSPALLLVPVGAAGLYLMLRAVQRRGMHATGIALAAVAVTGAAVAAWSVACVPAASMFARLASTVALLFGSAAAFLTVTASDPRRRLAGYTGVSLTTCVLVAESSLLTASCVAVVAGATLARWTWTAPRGSPRHETTAGDAPLHEPLLACVAAGLIACALIAGLGNAG